MTRLFATLLFAASAMAQNHVPDGEFEQGGAGWAWQLGPLTHATGFAPARVTGNGPSMALHSTMQTPTGPLMTNFGSAWVSAPFTLPAQTFPVGCNLLWEKPGPLPLPIGNGATLDILNAANQIVLQLSTVSPDPFAIESRASVQGTFVSPGGTFRVRLTLLNGMPNLGFAGHVIWVDDVVVGAPVVFAFGQGCPGSANVAPAIWTENWPRLGALDFAFRVHDAFAPSVALLALGWQGAVGPGGIAPVPLGGTCNRLVSIDDLRIVPVFGTAGSGTAVEVLVIPTRPVFAGLQVFAQWGVVDPGSVPLQIAVTPGIACTVQL